MISEFNITQTKANSTQRKKGEPPREGLRTTREMAAEFGITFSQLTGHMAQSKTPLPLPQAQFVHRSRTASGKEQRTFFKPSEFRAWWKAEQEAAQ